MSNNKRELRTPLQNAAHVMCKFTHGPEGCPCSRMDKATYCDSIEHDLKKMFLCLGIDAPALELLNTFKGYVTPLKTKGKT